MRQPRTPILLLALLAGACGAETPPAPGPPAVALPPDAPRLVLFLVVDQGGAAQLERHRPLFSAGLARLLDESARFTEAHHLHADTDTAPGHATLATGRFPRGHGIVSNYWTDPETGEAVYAVDDPELDTSPRRLLGGTLGDWLKAAVPEARVFAASGKDRSAVLLGGHRADGAFWYDRETGRFTTSAYYGGGDAQSPAAPAWLDAFHREEPPVDRFGRAWEPLPEVAAAAAALEVAALDYGPADPWFHFPHPLGGLAMAPGERYFADLYATPFVDDYLGRFAAALIAAERLGEDAAPDLLALSFSAPDAAGHLYGPDSLEYADALVRLDRALGELLDAVDRAVGLERTLIVLSADHGVASAPEVAAARGRPGRRAGAAEVLCVQGLEAALAARFGPAGGGRWLRPGPFFEPAALAAAKVDRRRAEAAAREHLEACPGVARVWTRSELEAAALPDEAMAALFAHSFHPERSPDLTLQLDEGLLAAPPPFAASHGSPYRHDTHVPWLVRGAGIAPRAIPSPVATADVAPTVAALVGIPVPDGLDGVDRSDALRRWPR
jgi:predicted AlkP superfamily pyrophosphatase or phosphodiesterase